MTAAPRNVYNRSCAHCGCLVPERTAATLQPPAHQHNFFFIVREIVNNMVHNKNNNITKLITLAIQAENRNVYIILTHCMH